MGVVKGAIEIKDNMTAVLRSIRQEQSAFRQDVEKTKKELQATWDRKRTAKLETTPAAKAMDSLKKKMEPLRKKLVVAAAVKDMATAKVKAVGNKVKAVGKLVATPVIKVVTKGAQALSAIGKGFAKLGKAAALGVGAVAAAGAAGLAALFSGSTEAAKAQIEAETKLEAVLGNVKSIQTQGAGAAAKAKENLMGVASSLQQVGVIGDEVTLAGMQQLATFQLSDKEITTLAGGMTDLLAQQKGLNATQEDSVTIANMIGKAMNGQVGALSRVGISFTDAQAKALEMADSEGRAAILAEILQQNVGGVNQALAETDQGKIQQMSNAWGDMKEEVGKVTLSIKAKFASVMMKNIPTVQKLGTTLMKTLNKFADFAMPILDKVISNVTPAVESVLNRLGSVADALTPVLSNVFDGLAQGAQTVRPVLDKIVKGFGPLLPPLIKFGGIVMATVQQVATAVMPALASIIGTVQSTIPSVLPVLETVISSIGSIISAAAPIIAGMVEGIGTVVKTLAPVFDTIFSGIGEKVGTVIDFVSSKMGFIQEVINTAAPLIADILSTAWSVISPVLDLAVNVFNLIFSVVQKVFPGVQKVIETVWGVIKPIVENVGWVLGKIGDGIGWISDKLGGGGKEVGNNAEGTNNWRGGPTWVGERGPELVDLPRGSRVLPNKESVQLAQNAAQPMVREVVSSTVERSAVREVVQNTVTQPIQQTAVPDSSHPMERVEQYLGRIADLLTQRENERQQMKVSAEPVQSHGSALSMREVAQYTVPVQQVAVPDGSSPMERVEQHMARIADLLTQRENEWQQMKVSAELVPPHSRSSHMRENVKDTVGHSTVREAVQNTVHPVQQTAVPDSSPYIERIEKPVKLMAELLRRKKSGWQQVDPHTEPPQQRDSSPYIREIVNNKVERSVVREMAQNTAQPVLQVAVPDNRAFFEFADKRMKLVADLLGQQEHGQERMPLPTADIPSPSNTANTPSVAKTRRDDKASAGLQPLEVRIAKLADTIIVREEADVDKLGEAVAKQVTLAVRNMVPV